MMVEGVEILTIAVIQVMFLVEKEIMVRLVVFPHTHLEPSQYQRLVEMVEMVEILLVLGVTEVKLILYYR